MADAWEQFFAGAAKRAMDAGKGARAADSDRIARLMIKIGKNKGHVLGAGLGLAPILLPFMARHATSYATGLVDPIKKVLTGTGVGQPGIDEMVAMQKEAESAALQQSIRQQEMEKLAAVNEQRLMTVAPGVATQLLAGRILPRNAMVIGGNPRKDLLREFASQMATSPRFQGPPQGSEEFLQ